MITPERLRELLRYDPETGEFTWRVKRPGTRGEGSVAGCICRNRAGLKYRYIALDGRLYLAHRLAWFFVHRLWPRQQIDHADGDGLNNRIANLREASLAENARNRRAPTSNTSGFKGVSWVPKDKRWRAQIWVNGRNRHLGCFDDPAKAHAAYVAAASELHGDFANTEVKI